MRRNGRFNTKDTKFTARLKYKERKIDTFIKWSIKQRGGLRWKDLMFIHDKYNIKAYG